MEQFNFGKNWKEFSEKALSPDKIENARSSFKKLFHSIELQNKSFLDIGFGQGLSLLIATESGAETVGNDINPICKEVLDYNKNKFVTLENRNIPTVVGSILDNEVISKLKSASNDQLYDIVHSWGVLHHTGKMWQAITNAAGLVKGNGFFVIAIYNKHWTCKIWWLIKVLYNKSPRFIQKIMIYSFSAISFLRLLIAGKSPLKSKRGMDFYYDKIDWLGGYPYEYASQQEIENHLKLLGFKLKHFYPAFGFTGCNEFVFKREL